ncbi:MAG: FAD-dependent thymidylate synthase [Candidatus Aenigmatarchaeota archaeon]|nr:MAG: FAD-dependent thymidylate synthase [Candidatus Aenigmarchaeota archaeon]
MSSVLDPPSKVELIAYPNEPLRIAGASAKSCYSPRAANRIVLPDEVPDEALKKVVQDTFNSGHQVFGHPTFTFALENVSRNLIHDFFHLPSTYVTDQISQRYVSNRTATVRIPPFHDSDSRDRTRKRIRAQWDAYAALIPILEEELKGIKSEARGKLSKRDTQLVPKQAIETARYVLPIAALSGMYYTVNLSTLNRLALSPKLTNVPWEAQTVVEQMMAEARKTEPELFDHIGAPLQRQDGPSFKGRKLLGDVDVAAYNAQFDKKLNPYRSKLVTHTPDGDRILADAVRIHLGAADGVATDEQLIGLVMNPANNRTLLHPAELEHMDPASYAMGQVAYTFRKKLSHTADSQGQRHRATKGIRPRLQDVLTREPDTVAPELIAGNAEALQIFNDAMEGTWEDVRYLLDNGESREFVAYLLPNATALRIEETTDLFGARHKWELRTCLRTQEEEWKINRDEVNQVREVTPLIGNFLGPPCHLRKGAGVGPMCNQGKLFCGKPVWDMDLNKISYYSGETEADAK